MKRLIIFLIALSINASLYAQSPSSSPNTLPTATPTPTPAVSPTPSAEVIALRAQLELMRQYEQNLLSTVYWSLSVIVGLVILLAGYGWYTNFRVYERDKNAMQQDLQGYLQQEMGKLSRSTGEANERFRGEMLTDITQRIESVRAAAIDASKVANEHVLEQILFLKIDLRKVEGWYWENRQVFYAAFVTRMQMLEDVNSLKRKFSDIPDSIYENLFRDFETVLNNEFKIDEKFYKRTEEALSNVPPAFTENVNKIRELMKSRT